MSSKQGVFPIKHTQSVHITEVPGACPSSIVEFSTLSQYVSLSFQPKLLEKGGWVCWLEAITSQEMSPRGNAIRKLLCATQF